MCISRSKVLYFCSLILFVLGCGGGGGGGGGGRTTDTALRVVHASLDRPPVVAKAGEAVLPPAAFGEVTSYTEVNPGPATVIAERANVPAPVAQLPADFAANTEYTLFLYGQLQTGSANAKILEEPVAQPGPGKVRVQLLNALEGSSSLVLNGAGFSSNAAGFGSSSGFSESAPGPQTLTITNGRTTIAQVAVDIPDQGEATVLIAGSNDLGVKFTRVYSDLD